MTDPASGMPSRVSLDPNYLRERLYPPTKLLALIYDEVLPVVSSPAAT